MGHLVGTEPKAGPFLRGKPAGKHPSGRCETTPWQKRTASGQKAPRRVPITNETPPRNARNPPPLRLAQLKTKTFQKPLNPVPFGSAPQYAPGVWCTPPTSRTGTERNSWNPSCTLPPGREFVFADGGYAGALATWIKDLPRSTPLRLEIIKRSRETTGFHFLPKR